LHTGVTPPHSAFELQLTQVPVATLQVGMDTGQRVTLVAEHTPHAPDGWQAGVAPVPQSASPAQARQVWVAPSQTGVVPEQSASARHATQVPLGVKHSGVPPVHCTELPAEHWPHAPAG
jgi:hypothetical protein